MPASPKNNTNERTDKIEKELRKEPRKFFNGTIFYATEEQLYEGEVKNYSPSGVFVKTKGRFFSGQTLNLALPYSKAKNSKRLGKVIWQNTEGIGVELESRTQKMN